MTERVPDEVLEPIFPALVRPMMWAYCEGSAIAFVILLAIPGPLILRTWSSTIGGMTWFAIGWIICRALGTWDARAMRVFRRARRYRNVGTATLPARSSWGSPVPIFSVRRH